MLLHVHCDLSYVFELMIGFGLDVSQHYTGAERQVHVTLRVSNSKCLAGRK